MKLHPCPLLLITPACLQLIFLYQKIEFGLLYQFFLFLLLWNHHILEQVKKIMLRKNNLRAHQEDFANWKLMEKAMRFTCGKIYYRIEIRWNKRTHTFGNVWVLIFEAPPIRQIPLHFPMLWKFEKSILTMGNA